MSDSINALIAGQHNAGVIDSLANPPQINVLGSISRAAEAAKTVMGVRALQAHQAWNDALAAATDKTTGVIDYPAAFKAFSTSPMATYGMQEAATGASGLQNDQVTRAHYQLGIYQGLFGSLPDDASREQLLATVDKGIALGLSPTDGAREKAIITSTADKDLSGLIRQFRFSGENGANQAGYGAGWGGMDAKFLNEYIDVQDPDYPDKRMTIRRGEALQKAIPGARTAPAVNAPAASTAPATSSSRPAISTAPPDPSTINPSYSGGFKPTGGPLAAPAPAAAPASTAIPSSAFAPPASAVPPSATMTTTPPIVVPSTASGGPPAVSAPAATPPPPPNYGGPPAAGAGGPGAIVQPPPAVPPSPRGVPGAANAPGVGSTLAALNPFRVGPAEAQSVFRGPGPQREKDINAYNDAVPTIQPQRQTILAGETALKALELANTGPGTGPLNVGKQFLIAHGWPGADAIDVNAVDARSILVKNLIRFAQANGKNVSTDFAKSLELEGNPNADLLLKSANREILIQDVGIARQKLAQTLTIPSGGVGKTEFGDGTADHVRNFSGKTDWHGFAWDWMDPQQRGAYLAEIGDDKRKIAIFEKSKQIAKEQGLWTRAPDAPRPTAAPPATQPTVNLLTPPAR